MAITAQLRTELAQLDKNLSQVKSKQNDYLEANQYDQSQQLNTQVTALNSQIQEKNQELNAEYQSLSSTIKVTDNSLIGVDQSELESYRKYQRSEVLGDISQPVFNAQQNTAFAQPGRVRSAPNSIEQTIAKVAGAVAVGAAGAKLVKNLFNRVNGNNVGPTSVTANFTNKKSKDLRTKIIVPRYYLENTFFSPYIPSETGIIFPYTPNITFEQSARYTEQSPTHSNYPLYFYKNSSISSINISGKFTVQNNQDALFFLSTLHLLRVLTKMKWGADADAGSPPPVCRLDAYGVYMLKNIPIAISSFRYEAAENVDYYTFDRDDQGGFYKKFQQSAVPVISTISITCVPMYSRDELSKFSADKLLSEYEDQRDKGYI